jgi:hypothetical protein
METNSTVARYTLIGYWIPNNSKIYLTSKGEFRKICISLSGLLCIYRYFSKNTTNAIVFWEIFSMKQWNLIEITRTIFEKIAILFSVVGLKSHCFWSWKVQIRQALTYDESTDNWWIQIKLVQPRIHADIQTDSIPKTMFTFSGGWNCVIPSKYWDWFFLHNDIYIYIKLTIYLSERLWYLYGLLNDNKLHYIYK